MGSERKARCPYIYVFVVASPMFNSNELNYELS